MSGRHTRLEACKGVLPDSYAAQLGTPGHIVKVDWQECHLTGCAMEEYAVLGFDDLRIALPLHCIERVIRAVYLTPLPNAPDIVLGMVNVQGHVIPAINLRKRFRLAERDIALTDQVVIAHTGRRTVALVTDTVHGIFKYEPPDIASAETILPGLEYLDGVVKLEDGLILIHNLDRFLSLEEEQSLDRAMASSGNL